MSTAAGGPDVLTLAFAVMVQFGKEDSYQGHRFERCPSNGTAAKACTPAWAFAACLKSYPDTDLFQTDTDLFSNCTIVFVFHSPFGRGLW
jgi:hypothetical protein